jgi:hypothetical protein
MNWNPAFEPHCPTGAEIDTIEIIALPLRECGTPQASRLERRFPGMIAPGIRAMKDIAPGDSRRTQREK